MTSVFAMSGDGLALSCVRLVRALQMLLLLAEATFASSCMVAGVKAGSKQPRKATTSVVVRAALQVYLSRAY
jgi:hypothetical protein